MLNALLAQSVRAKPLDEVEARCALVTAIVNSVHMSSYINGGVCITWL